MKISQIILIIVAAIVFLMLGCFLFFCVFIGLSSIEDVLKDVYRLYAHRFIAGFVGAIFLSMGYAIVKFLIKSTYKDELFITEDGAGRTSVALVAVEDIIRKALKKYANIKRFKFKVRVRNKVLVATINLVLLEGKAASEVVSEVKEKLMKKLRNFVGLTKANMSIEVMVTKVVELKKRNME